MKKSKFTITGLALGALYVLVAVLNPQSASAAVTCSLSATDTSIVKGESTTLNWSRSGGGSLVGIDPIGYSSTAASGSKSVSPTSTTTYTLTVDLDSKCTKSVKVTVTQATVPQSPAPTCEVSATAYNVVKGGSVTVYWTFYDTRSGVADDRGGDVPDFDRTVRGQSTFTVNNAVTYSFYAKNADHAVRKCASVSFTISADDHALAADCLSAAASKVVIVVEYRDINTGQLISTSHGVNVSANRGTQWCTKAGYTSRGWSVSNINPPISPGPFEQNFTASKTFYASGGVLTIEVDCMGPTTIGNVNVNIPGYTRVQNYNPPNPNGSNGSSFRGTVYYQKDVPDVEEPDDPLPFCSIWAADSSVDPGGTTVIAWYSTDATTANLWDKNEGTRGVYVIGPGTTTPPITEKTVYWLTVYGPGGSYSCSTAVDVIGTPTADLKCSILVTPNPPKAGDTTTTSWTVSWTTENATEFTLDGMPQSPITGGSIPVSPTSTTTYKGRALGAGGQSFDCEGTVFFEATGPYYKVYGGDVSVGGGFGEACTIQNDATILAFNKKVGDNHVGAGTQLAAYALGVINGFGTSQARTPTSRKQLTFANTAPTNLFGGELDQKHIACIPDYWAGVSRAGVISNPNASSLGGLHKIVDDEVTLNARNLGISERITLYIEGNVRIAGDIRYAGGSPSNPQSLLYTGLSQVPSFRLIVKGNIYVDPDVRELNGTFVAIPKTPNDANSGKFYTCSNNFGPPNVDQLRGACRNLLTVYGSVVADTIKLTRSRGNVDNANVNERYNNNDGEPAEKFIYTPESWLTSDFGGTGDNDSFGSLPPVL